MLMDSSICLDTIYCGDPLYILRGHMMKYYISFSDDRFLSKQTEYMYKLLLKCHIMLHFILVF